MKEIKVPVLIVGGGSVGLALALDLGWRGIECRLVEQGAGVHEHPRAGLISVRTMEFFRRWGIADKVRHCGFPADFPLSNVFCTSLNGHLLERADYPSIQDTPTPSWTPEIKQRCPQNWLDPILVESVSSYPSIRIDYNMQLESFEQTADHVRAIVRGADGNEDVAVTAQYMVGCDGAAGTVRKSLGLDMSGNPKLNYSLSILFRAPDLLGHFDKGKAERFIFVGPEGTWSNLTVIDGVSTWRLTIYGTEEKLDLQTFDARAQVRRALGREDVPFEIISLLPWKRTELVAESFHVGRVFLAGDAAHTMSPTGGMGMNTGMGDAADLGWKLQGALAGWGGANLLASYTVERRPIAERNCAYSTRNFKTWMSPRNCEAILDDTAEGAAVRSQIGTHLKQSTQYEWESWGLQVGYRYENSPIIVTDGTPPTEDDYSRYVPTSRPGSRAPHFWLADGESVLDRFGKTFTLLAYGDTPTATIERAASERRVPFQVIRMDEQAVSRADGLYDNLLTIVRPDGHVAWRGEFCADPVRLIDRMRGHEA